MILREDDYTVALNEFMRHLDLKPFEKKRLLRHCETVEREYLLSTGGSGGTAQRKKKN